MRAPRGRPLPALLGPTLLVLVLAGIGFAALRSATPAGSEPVDGTLLSSRTGTFRISGKVKGLYPGAQRKMKLQVRNLSGIPIRVVSIKVRTRSPSPQCSARNVRVRPYTGRLVVSAHATRRVKLPISMKKRTPPACQGARFPLIFEGRAVRA